MVKLAGYLLLAAGTLVVRAIAFFTYWIVDIVGAIEKIIMAVKARRHLASTGKPVRYTQLSVDEPSTVQPTTAKKGVMEGF